MSLKPICWIISLFIYLFFPLEALLHILPLDILKYIFLDTNEVNVFQVMLGSGEKQYEDWMRATESSFKDKYRGWVGFNVPISHRITAGYVIRDFLNHGFSSS